MIVQDIDTAHHTLGHDPLPEKARRPDGIQGFVPPVITRPKPDDPEAPICLDNPYSYSQAPPDNDPLSDPPDADLPDDPMDDLSGEPKRAWTAYQSEAVNIGPMRPKDVEILYCNASFTGQLYNGPDQVLKQYRAQRLFTAAQRRAILARDKGCQAPSCTTPAVWCDIHHIEPWQHGGLTNEDNGIALCPRHHEAVHSGRYTIIKYAGKTWFQPATWLNPDQPLLRNAYFNTR